MANSKKRVQTVKDPELNRIIADIYKEINSINDSVNHPSLTHRLSPFAGNQGDIKLYEDAAVDGGTSYFLQGKFKDGWAAVNLSLQSSDPVTATVASTDPNDIGGISINQAKELVNFTNLNANNSVGEDATQVPFGSHQHDHADLTANIGTATHDQIDAHLDLGPSTIGSAEPEIHAISGNLTGGDIGLTQAHGSVSTWARTDHKHAIDQGIVPTWTGAHQFDAVTTHHANVIIGETGNLASLTINNTGGTALTVTGEMDLSGALNIVYSEANSNDLTVSGWLQVDEDATIGQTVILNDSVTDNPATYTTTIKGDAHLQGTNIIGSIGDVTRTATIHGETFINANTTIESDQAGHALILNKALGEDESHIKMYAGDANVEKYVSLETGMTGNLNITAKGNIQLYPNDDIANGAMLEGAVLPKGTRIADLGAFNRMWRTGYFAELYVETLVAQDVLATIGGRIMVAPTSIVEETISYTSTTLKLKHNNFFPGDYAMFKAAPAGLPCFEVMQITEGPTYTEIGNIVSILELEDYTIHQEGQAGSMRNEYAERNLKILVTLDDDHDLDDGDFVVIQGTGGHAINKKGFDGAYKIAYLNGDSEPEVTSGACGTTQFAISAPYPTLHPDVVISESDYEENGPSGDGNNTFNIAARVKGPPFEYTVRRNQDNTLANQWNIGDAAVNIGYKEGDGYIELTSTETLHNALGPQMAIFSRTGTNLISNTGFDVNTDSWTLTASLGNTVTHNTDTEHVYTGSGSIKLTRDGTDGNAFIEQTITGPFAVDDELVIEFWAKTTITGSPPSAKSVFIVPSDSGSETDWEIVDGGAELGQPATYLYIDGDTWQRKSILIACTAISGDASAAIRLYHGLGGGNAGWNIAGDIYIDNVSVYVNPAWNGDVPTVAMGNLNNYVDYNDDSRHFFGFAVGNNLTLSGPTGFRGMTADGTNGIRMFNTDISLYEGDSLKGFIGTEDIDDAVRPVFEFGSDLASGTYAVRFGWDIAAQAYQFNLNGAFLSLTNIPESIDNQSVDYDDLANLPDIGALVGAADINWSQITAGIPAVLDDISAAGCYTTSTFLGMYSGNGDASVNDNWPIRIKNNGGNGEFFVGGTGDASSEYMAYTAGGGLVVNGSITVTSWSDPSDLAGSTSQAVIDAQQQIDDADEITAVNVGLLADIAADDKLTPSEKLIAKPLYDDILAEKITLSVQASAAGLPADGAGDALYDFGLSYSALIAYVALDDIFAESNGTSTMDDTTTIVRATWDAKWSDYYQARDELLAALLAKAMLTSEVLMAEWPGGVSMPYPNEAIPSYQTTIPPSGEYHQYDFTLNNYSGSDTTGWLHLLLTDVEGGLMFSVNSGTPYSEDYSVDQSSDSGTPESNARWFSYPVTGLTGATQDVKLWSWKIDGITTHGVVVTVGGPGDPEALWQAHKAQRDADAALSDLTDIADDDKVTPDEKLVAKVHYTAITNEYAGIVAQALTVSATSTTYTTNYDALVEYIDNTTEVFGDNMAITTAIDRATWESKWQAYYTGKAALLNLIVDAAYDHTGDPLTQAEIETILGYTGSGSIIGDLFDDNMRMDLSNAYISGNTLIDSGVIATNFVNADTIAGIDIIGHVIKTSASGKRIEINGTENDLLFYNASGAATIKIDDNLYDIEGSNSTFPAITIGSDGNPGILKCDYTNTGSGGTRTSSLISQGGIVQIKYDQSGQSDWQGGEHTRSGIYGYNSIVNTLMGVDIDVSYPSTQEVAALTISSKNTRTNYTAMDHAIFIKEGDIHSESQSFIRMWHTAKEFRAVASTGYESNVNAASKEIWFNAYQSQGNGLVEISQSYQNGGYNLSSWTGYNAKVNKDGIYLISGVVAAMTNGMPGTTHMLRMLVTNNTNSGSQHYSSNQGNKHYLLHKKDVNQGSENSAIEDSMPFSIAIPLYRGDILRLQHYNNTVAYFNMYGSCRHADGETHEGSPNEDGSSITIMKLA